MTNHYNRESFLSILRGLRHFGGSWYDAVFTEHSNDVVTAALPYCHIGFNKGRCFAWLGLRGIGVGIPVMISFSNPEDLIVLYSFVNKEIKFPLVANINVFIEMSPDLPIDPEQLQVDFMKIFRVFPNAVVDLVWRNPKVQLCPALTSICMKFGKQFNFIYLQVMLASDDDKSFMMYLFNHDHLLCQRVRAFDYFTYLRGRLIKLEPILLQRSASFLADYLPHLRTFSFHGEGSMGLLLPTLSRLSNIVELRLNIELPSQWDGGNLTVNLIEEGDNVVSFDELAVLCPNLTVAVFQGDSILTTRGAAAVLSLLTHCRHLARLEMDGFHWDKREIMQGLFSLISVDVSFGFLPAADEEVSAIVADGLKVHMPSFFDALVGLIPPVKFFLPGTVLSGFVESNLAAYRAAIFDVVQSSPLFQAIAELNLDAQLATRVAPHSFPTLARLILHSPSDGNLTALLHAVPLQSFASIQALIIQSRHICPLSSLYVALQLGFLPLLDELCLAMCVDSELHNLLAVLVESRRVWRRIHIVFKCSTRQSSLEYLMSQFGQAAWAGQLLVKELVLREEPSGAEKVQTFKWLLK